MSTASDAAPDAVPDLLWSPPLDGSTRIERFASRLAASGRAPETVVKIGRAHV